VIKEYIRQGGKENKGSESTKTGWKGGYGKCCIGRREGIGEGEVVETGRGEKNWVETWKREGYNGERQDGGAGGKGKRKVAEEEVKVGWEGGEGKV